MSSKNANPAENTLPTAGAGSYVGTFVKQYGSIGVRRTVTANFVPVIKYPTGSIYQYDVDLVSERGGFS
ncbi:hypothetical protein GGI07_005881, partial [Coemansia sp. Benny D115]